MDNQRSYRHLVIEEDICKIPLGPNARYGHVIVDREFEWLGRYKWTLDHGYARGKVGGRLVYLHHLVVGNPPKGSVVDHRDRNKLNCREGNLDFKTQAENILNTGLRQDNTSGYWGVYFDKSRNKWAVWIGKDKFIGRFKTIEEAVTARKRAEVKYFGFMREALCG